MSKTMKLVSVLVLFGAACQWQATPTPVAGDLEPLRGTWDGWYSSPETGRSGTISFELVAGSDSAYGEILMIPEDQGIWKYGGSFVPPDRPRSARPVPIAFVRCDGGDLTGTLEVYEDPESGERLLTTFEGRLVGREFKGTYRTRVESTGRESSGEWSVKRARGR